MIFVYQCLKCGAIIEHRKGMQDPHPDILPHGKCNGPVRHVFQSHGIHYRGKGFFKTDKEMRQMDKNLRDVGDEGLDVYDKRFGVRREK